MPLCRTGLFKTAFSHLGVEIYLGGEGENTKNPVKFGDGNFIIPLMFFSREYIANVVQ
jgi:hypothetical protein